MAKNQRHSHTFAKSGNRHTGSTCSIDNQNTKVGGESIICSNACDLTVYDGAVIKNAIQTKGIAALGTCRVDFDGEITGLKGNSNALNLQNGEFNVTLGKNANIHDNQPDTAPSTSKPKTASWTSTAKSITTPQAIAAAQLQWGIISNILR